MTRLYIVAILPTGVYVDEATEAAVVVTEKAIESSEVVMMMLDCGLKMI